MPKEREWYNYIDCIVERFADDCDHFDVFYYEDLIKSVAILKDKRIEISFDNEDSEPIVISYKELLDRFKANAITYSDECE